MSQSVKLKDESYIDASAVWDNDRQESVEDALRCSTVKLDTYIEAAGYVADNTARAEKQGRMVSLIFAASSSTATAGQDTWCTLPEGYRPKGYTPITAMALSVGATNLRASIYTTGEIKLAGAVPANTWWGFAVSYLTD